jgi:hypothetical protein
MSTRARSVTSCAAIALLLACAPLLIGRGRVSAGAQAPVDIAAQPRIENASNLVWQGSFRVSDQVFGSDADCGGTSCASFAYGGSSLAFRHDAATGQDSLFLVGHDQGQLVAEIGVPSPGTGPTTATLPLAGMLQPFADPTEGRMESVNAGSGTAKKIGGLLVYQNKLYSTVYDFYDGASTQVTSHFVSGLNLGVSGDAVGPQRVKFCLTDDDCLKAGFFDGYFGLVPSEWQASLGGPVLNGNCCLNVIGRTSWGPAAFAVDPAQLGVRDAAGELPEVLAKPLVYYFSDGSSPADGTGNFHALAEDVLRPADPAYPANDACHNTSALFNCSSEVRGLVFPQGTRSVLFFGRQGLGTICYGQGTSDKTLQGQLVDPVNEPDVNYCFDPADHNKGFHAWPYAHYVWAYDANDLKSVRDGALAPWDLKPYTVFQLNLPLDTPFGDAADTESRRIGGAAYDAATGRIFLSQIFDDGRTPVIHVFTLNLGTPPPPPPPPANHAPTIDAIAGQTGTVGVAFSVQAAGHDQDLDTLTYSAAGLPAGLAINQATGRISGIPTTAGDSIIVVTVSDSLLSAATSFALHVVSAPPPPSGNPLVSPGPQRNIEGDKVELEIQVLLDRDGKGKGRRGTVGTFSAVNLPPGLRIDSRDGEIEEHIQNGAASDSPYHVTVTLTAEGHAYSVSFDWTVLKAARKK